MSDVLRDPIWQFIGAVLAALAVFISVIVYLKQRRRKSLSYAILTNTSLLKWEALAIKERLQLTYDGKAVQQASLIIVKIINSGSLPIISSDYELPVSLGFGKAKILSAEIAEVHPRSLNVSISVEGDTSGEKVVISPTLLNSGDWIALKILVAGFEYEIVVDGRIVGVNEIRKSEKQEGPFWVFLFVGFVSYLVGLGGSLVVSFGNPLWPYIFVLVVVGLILETLGFVNVFDRYKPS
jgi:hypothetical protein